MSAAKKFRTVSLVLGTFFGFVGIIYVLALKQIATPQLAGLMVVALIGLYVGFGILILVYRLISKLD
jgi:xanthosine utilization system XapX-like protein